MLIVKDTFVIYTQLLPGSHQFSYGFVYINNKLIPYFTGLLSSPDFGIRLKEKIDITLFTYYPDSLILNNLDPDEKRAICDWVGISMISIEMEICSQEQTIPNLDKLKENYFWINLFKIEGESDHGRHELSSNLRIWDGNPQSLPVNQHGLIGQTIALLNSK